jgi:SepF-like predicted cell division protein (DUF552 family)
MSVKGWLGFEEEEEAVDLSEYLENIGLHEGELLDEDKFTYIKSLSVNTPNVLADLERELRKGNLIILDTEPLANTNKLALKKVISDLKDLEREIDGDMGRVSETKILIVPGEYRILKRRGE